MTYRYALSDIEKLLEQNIENGKFAKVQILFWILCLADSLRAKHIVKNATGAYLHQYPQIPIQLDTITGRKFFYLPTQIYDLPIKNGNGIDYVSYDFNVDGCSPAFTSIKFDITTPAASERLYYTEEETPSPDNPYIYRIDMQVFTLGIECIDVPYLEGAFYSTFDPNTTCDLDEEFNFPVELYPVLQKQILDLARFGLMIPQNTKNMGIYALEEQLSGVPKTKLVSVSPTDTTTDTTTE
jgi:hypothetical protein